MQCPISTSKEGRKVDCVLVQPLHWRITFSFIYVSVYSQSNMQMFCLKKNNFSALGGSKVAILGGDDLDPIYFEVHMFLNPPGPPYMSKNAQMCYFYHFLGVPFKTYPQSRGPP